MPKVRIFENPDGSVRVVHLNPKRRLENESDADFEARIFARTVEADPTLDGLPFSDIEVAALPTDRSKRYAWKRQGNAVIVDPSVLPPPHPKQKLLDDINKATTIDGLKTLMTKMVRGT